MLAYRIETIMKAFKVTEDINGLGLNLEPFTPRENNLG
jgi:hypothetical protein